MDQAFPTEAVSSRYEGMDAWGAEEIARSLWESQLAAVAAVDAALPTVAEAAAAVASRLRHTGRLCYIGAGTSARVAAQDATELEPTFGWPSSRLSLIIAGGPEALLRSVENAEDDTEAARSQVVSAGIGAGDVVIGIAASGRTPFTVSALKFVRERGSLTIGLAGATPSPLLTTAHHPICVATGAEPIAGSTRLKAGTAQKVVLNLLSTTVMTLLGHVYNGLMVDMQPRNEKLRARGRDMVVRISGCDPARAEAALAQAGGNVKRAVLLLRGLETTTADALLAQHEGNLRTALAACPT